MNIIICKQQNNSNVCMYVYILLYIMYAYVYVYNKYVLFDVHMKTYMKTNIVSIKLFLKNTNF